MPTKPLGKKQFGDQEWYMQDQEWYTQSFRWPSRSGVVSESEDEIIKDMEQVAA